MLLAIDIGNSDITFGLHDAHQWSHVWRMPSDASRPDVFYGMRIRDYFFESRISEDGVEQVVISSVVPALAPKFQEIIRHVFDKEALVLGPEVYAALPVKTLNPYQIGADLVANAVAAWTRYNSDCVVVDFGTALTFTVVKDNQIHGVAIAPGVKTALRSLTENTAKLFEVPIEMPKSVFGKNTIHAIQSGILFGYEGLVRGMVERIKAEILNDKIPVIATGGLSEVITPLEDVFTDRDLNLTLEGLRIVATYAHA